MVLSILSPHPGNKQNNQWWWTVEGPPTAEGPPTYRRSRFYLRPAVTGLPFSWEYLSQVRTSPHSRHCGRKHMSPQLRIKNHRRFYDKILCEWEPVWLKMIFLLSFCRHIHALYMCMFGWFIQSIQLIQMAGLNKQLNAFTQALYYTTFYKYLKFTWVSHLLNGNCSSLKHITFI